MKLTQLTEFLTLPRGTVFSVPCNFDNDTGPLCIKGENFGDNNFEYSYLIGSSKEINKLISDLRDGNSTGFIESGIIEKDDFWFESIDFLVYEYCDIEEMLITLSYCLSVADI